MGKDIDIGFLLEAVELARKGLGHTRPNPAVGAVIVNGGRIVGRGWHRRAGLDHAEVAAIRDALRHGHSIRGATIYVTLEPCSKPGRVGACTDAIIAAGIERVVYGAADPNPTNRGKAKHALARAGITCERCQSSEVTAACNELIKAFRKHVTTGLPFVTVKIAMSLDGRICDNFGDARWISSMKARRLTGRMREVVDAIMVGAETVRRDNPSLLSHGKRNDDLLRVVVTRSGKLPKAAQVFMDGKNETVVIAVPDGDMRKAMLELGQRGISHVLCEGGLKLARALADADLVDEWISVLAPCVIGDGRIADKKNFKPLFSTVNGLKPNGDMILSYMHENKIRCGCN